jgi:hypothetical protein
VSSDMPRDFLMTLITSGVRGGLCDISVTVVTTLSVCKSTDRRDGFVNPPNRVDRQVTNLAI